MSRVSGSDLLSLGAYHVPKVLLPPGGRAALRPLEDQVAGSSMILYECRMLDQGKGVDISTLYKREEAGAERLLYLCEAVSEPWGAVLQPFARRWAQPGDLTPIDTVYLEFDCAPDGQCPAAPAIFLSVEDGLATAPQCVGPALSALGVMPDGLRHDLQALFALADTVGVTLGRLLGLMLSRSGEVRVMLKGEPGDIASLLQRLGWTGDAAFAKRALDAVPVRTDGLRFVLGRGVSGGWNPDFGIEVFCADETEHEAVRGWLTGLLGQDRDRVQALEAWRGGAGFLDGGRLVHDFAVPTPGPNDLPSAAIKTVNHYKLNYAGGRLSEAKAYLSLASAS